MSTRAVLAALGIALAAFVYIPLVWATLTWAWRTIGAFWGVW